MKDYQKYIFDVDYTLLIPDWSEEDNYFRKNIAIEEQEEFFKKKLDIVVKYEDTHSKYDYKVLSDYFLSYGFHLSEELIEGWMIHNGDAIKDEIPDGIKELFEYLKENNKEIIVLSNWPSITQVMRLKKTGLYEYVDKLIGGETAMKPNIEAFNLAIGDTNKEDCLMIGDSIRTDKIGADNAGIDSYIVDKQHSIRNLVNQLKANQKKKSL